MVVIIAEDLLLEFSVSYYTKTTFIQKIVSEFKARNTVVGGIYSPRVLEKEKTIGYDVVDILTNDRKPFL
jgi:nucleoside-triphosphatase THEP1